MKQKFNIITSTCVPLPLENVDTDQIIPARFLKATTREESFFGENLFRDWRYNADGTVNKDFVLNNPTYGGEILACGGQRGLPGRIVCFHRGRPEDAGRGGFAEPDSDQ